MTAITQELGQIETAVSTLVAAVNDLETDLQLDTSTILTALQQQGLTTPFNAINSSWDSMVSLAQTGLQQARAAARGGSETPSSNDRTRAFATQVMTTWSTDNPMGSLVSSLLTGVGTGQGLINQWADQVILDMVDAAHNANSDVRTAYLNFESYFVQVVQYIYQGHTVLLNANMLLAVPEGDDPSSADQVQAAQAAGTTYLTNIFKPAAHPDSPNSFEKISNAFLANVHRIVLADYMRMRVDNTDFIPFTAQSDVDFILGRANLIGWLMNRDPDDTDPGIVTTSYLRPGQLSGNAGPSLHPDGYAAKTGRALDLSALEPGVWHKVLDFTDTDFTTIRPYGDSDIVVMNYIWSDPVPPTGKAVGAAPPFSNIIPANFSRTTLYSTNGSGTALSASDETVVYGFACDCTGITDNLVWPNSGGWKAGYDPSVQDSPGGRNFTCTPSVVAQISEGTPARSASVTFGFQNNPPDPRKTYGCSLTRSFSNTNDPSNSDICLVAKSMRPERSTARTWRRPRHQCLSRRWPSQP